MSNKDITDTFKSFLVRNAEYEGYNEIPVIKPVSQIPNRLISFSRSMKTNDFDCWVHFYEEDYKFMKIWKQPRRYISHLSKFNGVITPDFSLYRNMPLCMQLWNTYRGKALGTWWQSMGLNVIPNVRSADSRSYEFCCDGVARHSIISVGSHGCMKKRNEREIFKRGLEFIVKRLEPSCIVVYGTAPDEVFGFCKESGIQILQFDSETAQFFRNRKEVK